MEVPPQGLKGDLFTGTPPTRRWEESKAPLLRPGRGSARTLPSWTVVTFYVSSDLGPESRVVNDVRDGTQGGPIHRLELPCKKPGGALLRIRCFQEKVTQVLPCWDRPEHGDLGRAQRVGLCGRV